jgi:peptidoglycan/LPS O-acetylase OafA/YrhL
MVAKINSLEAGRALAAFTVVVFHANGLRMLWGMSNYDWLKVFIHGVDFFFIISGFIIFQVHRDDIGRPAAIHGFAAKRFIRLFPILWLIAGAWMVLRHVMHQPVPLDAIAPSLIPYPSLIKPLPDVIWTLRHEVMFYVAFLVLIFNRRAGVALFGLWTLGVVVQLGLIVLGRPVTGLPAFFLSSYELDFLLGAAVAWKAPQTRPSLVPLAAGLVLVTVALVAGEVWSLYRTELTDYTSVSASWWVMVLGVCFAVLLYGLLAVESLVKIPQWLVLLGGSSYALYLVHVPIQNVLAHLSNRMPAMVNGVLMIALPIAAGIALHLWFEKPVSRLLRPWLLRA